MIVGRSDVWFVVEGNPQPKERPRFARHAYTPSRTRAAEAKIAAIARANGVRLTTAPISLTVAFYRDSARRCDLDNLLKLVQDALNGIAWVDDEQIMDLAASKRLDRDRPRTDIRIEAYPDEVETASPMRELMNQVKLFPSIRHPK